MASVSREFVYEIPKTVFVGTRWSEQRFTEVVVSVSAAGWVAEVRGRRFDLEQVLGVTGWETRRCERGPVAFTVREGDQRVPDFVLDALRAAEAAGIDIQGRWSA